MATPWRNLLTKNASQLPVSLFFFEFKIQWVRIMQDILIHFLPLNHDNCICLNMFTYFLSLIEGLLVNLIIKPISYTI